MLDEKIEPILRRKSIDMFYRVFKESTDIVSRRFVLTLIRLSLHPHIRGPLAQMAAFRGLESLSVPGLFSVSLLIQRGLWLQSQYDNLLMMLPPQFEAELKYELFEIVTIAEVRKPDDGAVINGDDGSGQQQARGCGSVGSG